EVVSTIDRVAAAPPSEEEEGGGSSLPFPPLLPSLHPSFLPSFLPALVSYASSERQLRPALRVVTDPLHPIIGVVVVVSLYFVSSHFAVLFFVRSLVIQCRAPVRFQAFQLLFANPNTLSLRVLRSPNLRSSQGIE
ncbi:hypothetical protein NL676_007814, partial [Syzygium grande]